MVGGGGWRSGWRGWLEGVVGGGGWKGWLEGVVREVVGRVKLKWGG